MHDLQAARVAPLTDASATTVSGGGRHVPERPGLDRQAPDRQIVVLLILAAVVFALDAASKVLVVDHFGRHPTPIRMLGGLFYLEETRNAGAAFSVAGGATILFTGVAVTVVVVIARTAQRLRSVSWALALGLLLGGALGNLADRLLRSPGPGRGHVVDWIDFRWWPVFNLADSAIVVGGLLAVWLTTRGVEVDGTHHADAGAPEGGR